jgi:hypothetical protein
LTELDIYIDNRAFFESRSGSPIKYDERIEKIIMRISSKIDLAIQPTDIKFISEILEIHRKNLKYIEKKIAKFAPRVSSLTFEARAHEQKEITNNLFQLERLLENSEGDRCEI